MRLLEGYNSMWMDVVHKFRGLHYKIVGRRLGWGRRYEGASWSQSYRQGKWDYMRGPSERDRYGVLASFCNRGPSTSVLDVGCGEGILLDHFRQLEFTPGQYLGLDIASTAIETARREYPQARFDVADAETFETHERFDVIVLNECLYYFRRPMKVVRRLETVLRPGGVFAISTYHQQDSPQADDRYWELLSSRYDCEKHQAAVGAHGVTWNIGIFRPVSKH